jgi:hypothetical protein
MIQRNCNSEFENTTDLHGPYIVEMLGSQCHILILEQHSFKRGHCIFRQA